MTYDQHDKVHDVPLDDVLTSGESDDESGHETSEDNAQDNAPDNALDVAQKEAAHFKDQWMRAVAELDNLRKRSAKEREDSLKYAVTKFAHDMLSVSDNMTRALDVCPATVPTELEGVINGVRITQSELTSIFNRQGITEINPLGQMFDPNFHQAMFEIPLKDASLPTIEGEPVVEITSGMVVQILQSGYTIHGRLLRPALVGVAKG